MARLLYEVVDIQEATAPALRECRQLFLGACRPCTDAVFYHDDSEA